MSLPAVAAAAGIPVATAASILSSDGGTQTLSGNTGDDTPSVSELEVDGPAPTPPPDLTPLPLAVIPPATNILDGAPPAPDLSGLQTPTQPKTSFIPAAGIAGLTAAIATGDPSNIGDWIKANPVQAAGLGLTVAGVLGGAGATPGGGTISTNIGGAGTPASLGPQFTATLPPPTQAPMTRSALPQGIDWNRYAIEGPSQSFFSNVPVSPPAQFSVPTVAQIQQQGAANVGAPDIAAVRQKFAGPGYARGGRTDFAVKGPGTGRSDSIRARLSDGEYVVDAETVAMLGDGSNTAGADRLDKMRANLRKAKGKQLARGRFSVSAKAPETYMSGGRV